MLQPTSVYKKNYGTALSGETKELVTLEMFTV